MMIWIRNIIVIALILSVIYVILTLRSRFAHRRALTAEYMANKPNMEKDEYIAQGMVTYNRSVKPKLLLGVFGLPIIIGGLLIYLAQYS